MPLTKSQVFQVYAWISGILGCLFGAIAQMINSRWGVPTAMTAILLVFAILTMCYSAGCADSHLEK